MNKTTARFRYLGLFALTVALLILIFGRIMSFDLRKDEQIFVSPAVLLQSSDLYSGFFYNHTPFSAWWFYAVNALFGGTQITFASRFAVFLFWIAMAAGLHFFAFRFTKSLSVAAFATVLVLVNPALLNQTAVTGSNNFIPLVFAFFGIAFFLLILLENKPRWWLALLSGLMLSLAAATKVSSFIFIPVFATAALLQPWHLKIGERFRAVVFPFAAGGLIGALPVLVYLFRDPTKFLAHVVGFHTGPHVDYWSSRVVSSADDQVVMGLRGKLDIAAELWLTHVNLIAVLALIVLTVSWFSSRREQQNRLGNPVSLVVVLIALAAAIVMSFVPTPGFPQYFAIPIACLPLAIFVGFALLDAEQQALTKPFFLAGAILGLLLGLPRLVQHIPALVSPGKWEVSKVHGFGVKLAGRINELGLKGPVATLAPIYPLEGGLTVYPEMATGPFAFRVAPYLSPELKAQFVTTSAESVGRLLEANPPAAILVGFDAELERPLVDFALSKGYVQARDLDYASRYGTAVVYLKPGP